MQQIEVLKTVKIDKEDLEDALADKADAQAVIRKVRSNIEYVLKLFLMRGTD